MPRYHFQFTSRTHSADGGELYLPDDDAARLEAEVGGIGTTEPPWGR
jgi:hypothetical protein